MNPTMTNLLALVARVLLALMFLDAGYGKIGGFAGAAGYIASKGLPMAQVLAAAATRAGVVLRCGEGALGRRGPGGIHRRRHDDLSQLLDAAGRRADDAEADVPEECRRDRGLADDRRVRRGTLERRQALST